MSLCSAAAKVPTSTLNLHLSQATHSRRQQAHPMLRPRPNRRKKNHRNHTHRRSHKSKVSKRYEFALKLAEAFNLNKNLIKTLTMNEIKWKAKRLITKRKQSHNPTKPLNLEHSFEVMKKEKTRTGHKK
jgi:hypothetical protein